MKMPAARAVAPQTDPARGYATSVRASGLRLGDCATRCNNLLQLFPRTALHDLDLELLRVTHDVHRIGSRRFQSALLIRYST